MLCDVRSVLAQGALGAAALGAVSDNRLPVPVPTADCEAGRGRPLA